MRWLMPSLKKQYLGHGPHWHNLSTSWVTALYVCPGPIALSVLPMHSVHFGEIKYEMVCVLIAYHHFWETKYLHEIEIAI